MPNALFRSFALLATLLTAMPAWAGNTEWAHRRATPGQAQHLLRVAVYRAVDVSATSFAKCRSCWRV